MAGHASRLQGEHRLGVKAFATGSDAMLRTAGIFKGAAPADADWKPHTGAVWGELDSITAPMDMTTGILIGPAVFLGSEGPEQDR